MHSFKQEWVILHGNIEKYERFSLLIKLVAILVYVIAFSYSLAVWVSLMGIFILWLQDGIWKTFQKRLEERILFIEKEIANGADDQNDKRQSEAFQFYSQWENKRQGVVGLVKEYLSNSFKPTVAYPYLLLVFLIPTLQYYAG